MPDIPRRHRSIFNPLDYGAKGDGKTLDTDALQRAIDECSSSGGGTVFVATGKYLTGPLYLASHVTLHLESGSTILASPNRGDYGVVERRYSGTTQLTLEALINGENLEQVTITGRGVIDGQGRAFWQPIRDYYNTPKELRSALEVHKADVDSIRQSIWHRPRLVEPVNCRNVIIEGVTLQNSGFWNLHLLYCANVKLRGLTLINPPHGCNADGIDVDSCRDVMISDCLIDVGDDCICLKSGWDEDGRRIGIPTENVTITNCVTLAGHGGVVIGSDMSGGVRNIVANNCIFNGTEIGIRLKTMRGRGAVVENINFSNIVMDGVPDPIHIDMHYWKPVSPGPVDETTPRFSNLRLSQIEAVNAERAGYIHGLEEMPVENLRIDGMRITSKKAFWCRHAKGLELRNMQIECNEAPELQLEDIDGVEIDRFQVNGNHPPASAVRLTRTQRAYVHDSFAWSKNSRIIDLVETDQSDIREANNQATCT